MYLSIRCLSSTRLFGVIYIALYTIIKVMEVNLRETHKRLISVLLYDTYCISLLFNLGH